MTDPLSVNPDGLRTVAANVADVSSQMKQVLSSLKTQLAALGSPWGKDSIGDQFANGSSGYLAQVDQVNSSISAVTQRLDSVAHSLATSTDNFEQTDQQPGQTSGGGTGNVLATNVVATNVSGGSGWPG
jgi:WXG100 family type VII secretion target